MAEKLTEAQRRARALTQQGLCARCGKSPRAHRGGNCPDGQGSFTWALSRLDRQRLIASLEQLSAAAKQQPELTPDEQAALLAFDGNGLSLTHVQIAQRLGWSEQRASAALHGLQLKGMVANSREGSN